MKPFYMVIDAGYGSTATRRHDTEADAQTEAGRLCKKERRSFIILRAVDIVTPVKDGILSSLGGSMARLRYVIEGEIEATKRRLLELEAELVQPKAIEFTHPLDAESVASWDIGHLRKLLGLLCMDKALLCKHFTYGTFKVRMNQQHNRILVDPEGYHSSPENAPINEGTIEAFMLNSSTQWFEL